MNCRKNNIVVVGMGYVGMSMATLLAKYHKVIAVDVDPKKVQLINDSISPIKDEYIENYLMNEKLDLTAIVDGRRYYNDADFIIISVPTNYDDYLHCFDCTIVKEVIESIVLQRSQAVIVIKSTVPVGCTESLVEKYPEYKFLFCPEFLRESKALYDNLYPSRIIVGCNDILKESAKQFADILIECSKKDDTDVLYVGYSEAESIKLFSNTYLALRVAFFNELDTYAEMKGLSTEQIINGICLDSRIGNYYNNPSFGYGGYCLPKDTKQLLANYDSIPQNMMSAIVESNKTRKEHIAKRVYDSAYNKAADKGGITIGVYRLIMKSNSDNFRQSSIHDIIDLLQKMGTNVIIYEPMILGTEIYRGHAVESDFTEFKRKADLIIANRYDNLLEDVIEKVYTRDIFRND